MMKKFGGELDISLAALAGAIAALLLREIRADGLRTVGTSSSGVEPLEKRLYSDWHTVEFPQQVAADVVEDEWDRKRHSRGVWISVFA